jgi:cyclopropane-fatty-acyl-phospholipid synthase
MWQFYLSYCEGGFLERSIGDVQLLLARPYWRPRT